MPTTYRPATQLTGCPSCGTFQRVPEISESSAIVCVNCREMLERSHWRNRTVTLALALAAFALLLPANVFPFLTTSILGASQQSHLISSATAMAGNGFPLLAVVIGLFVVIFPFVRLALLIMVLGSMHYAQRPPWLGRAFRYACNLETWAMPDVFLLGLLVAYARLKASISIEVGTGAYCFIAVGILTLFIRATLDKSLIWRQIMADSSKAPDARLVTCPACELVLEQHAVGKPCPRCAAGVHNRKPDAVARALALTVAGAILYLPANIYPIASLPIGFTSLRYNILGGAIELLQSHLYPYAALVIVASFAIPMMKLAGIAWCIASVELRSSKALRAKTRVYRIIEEIGRWSMVDPFVIACFVPVSEYSSLVYGRAQPAAQAFTAVVILTIFAARCFDPRLMWDRARKTS